MVCSSSGRRQVRLRNKFFNHVLVVVMSAAGWMDSGDEGGFQEDWLQGAEGWGKTRGEVALVSLAASHGRKQWSHQEQRPGLLFDLFFRCKTAVVLPDSSELSPLEDITAFINVSLHLSSHSTYILLRHNTPIMP